MVVFSVWMINKAGSLIYQRTWEGQQMDDNKQLRLAGTMHSLHALIRQLSPAKGSSGMEMMECDGYNLFCTETPTQLKIMATADKLTKNLSGFLQE
eukprot:gene20163-7219_t